MTRTGVAEPTLRMWERRYGFPQPERTPSGHRRYSDEQVEMVDRVRALRASGLSLPAAIARVQAPPDPGSLSLYSALRELRPELEPRPVLKPVLIVLSHAIEDETLARADSLAMFGCFQRESFYRRSQARWRELASSCRVAAVFADFERTDDGGADPAEVPISRREQIAREWAIVAYGQHSSIAMVGREVASSNVDAAGPERSFELLWTVDPEAVRTLGRVCAVLASRVLPALAGRAEEALAVEGTARPADQLKLMTAVINRTLSALG